MIRSALVGFLRKETHFPRDPERVRNHRRALQQELVRSPTLDELSTHMGIDLQELKILLDLEGKKEFRAVRIRETVDELYRASAVLPADIQMECYEAKKRLTTLLTALPELKWLVVHQYFYGDKVAREIAEEIGLTESRVLQILKEIPKLLRRKWDRPV